MNKKLIIATVIFVLIGSLAAWLIFFNGNKKGKFPDRDFAVENIDDVGKIFIANRSGDVLNLEKIEGQWMVNQKHPAGESAMNVLLTALQSVSVKYIPPKAALERIVNDLAANGIKVEIYDTGGEKMKTYYVGGNISDDTGTAFIMDGYDQPYIIHIPGTVGALRSTFNLKEKDIIDRWLFKEKFEEVAFVSIEYPGQKSNSFTLENKNGSWELNPFYDLTPRINQPVQISAVEAFITGFERIGAEAIINDSPEKDSVLNLIPFAIISMRKTNGEEKSFKLFPIYDQVVEEGEKFDNPQAELFVERYFGQSHTGDFYLVQHRNFQKVLWGYSFFFPDNNPAQPVPN
jgi:hypothetical protein